MSRRPAGDDGMATALVLGLSAVLGVVVLVVGLLGAVVVARHRAASAADLAALAAASRLLDGAGAACAAARDTAAPAGADVASCRLDGDTVVVTATVPAPAALRALGLAGDLLLRSTARAGPVAGPGDDADRRQRGRQARGRVPRPPGKVGGARRPAARPALPRIPLRIR